LRHSPGTHTVEVVVEDLMPMVRADPSGLLRVRREWTISLLPNIPPSLALHLNQSSFTTGRTLRMDLGISNPGPALTTDVYVGAIMPDGNTVL
jgi:hypothetical protein